MKRYDRPLAEQTWLQAAIDQLETALLQLHATHGGPCSSISKPLDLRPMDVDTVNSIPAQFHR